MDYKERFTEIFFKNIKRDGHERLFDWLNKGDFFTAPASAKFHCAKKCGLVEHSVKVYDIFRAKHFQEKDNEETFAICALLHDVCKTNFYKISFRNVKNESGIWEKQSFYAIEDNFPYGHGEKSVFMIERFMRLSIEEAMAIRWHMAGFDESVKGGSFSVGLAYAKYPLCVKLTLADLESTYLSEKSS
ncbi:MAG: HD domain-containing protein [Candidatus Improbicoccus pseudotrichonymphae]|uniref:HD domain-containing protein n=1 Tax=Candidatus Improbicoccus pseudotrichonymphae TaxID=3033792 RepID=A0AA48IH72_9FIRM|nr:MAG: HD domain-containing protein [Candidatus Improbicoccus pseudotrichonymphae]